MSLPVLGRFGLRPAHGLEGVLEHLFHAAREVELHRVAHALRHVVDVLLVPLRQDDLGQAHAVGGQDLLLDAADRQHQSLKRHLSGHADGVPHRPVSRLTIAVVIVTPADGPSLGTAPSGTWMWNDLLMLSWSTFSSSTCDLT